MRISEIFLKVMKGHLGAQLIKCPTLDFGSDLDLRSVGSSPILGSQLSMELA